MSRPNIEARLPSTVKVRAMPAENTVERRKALFISLPPMPPTYPMTRGTLDKEQGVKEVMMPASSAKSGASHGLAVMADDRTDSH
ncbi:hypothetical protein SDC9_178227 [bioreactor metagenome]|uniref:Uncharacterized protein n=1 Tax=bioreactor metagenome TaxID=1076179 RepID=A0A645GWX1_9ZZZZ